MKIVLVTGTRDNSWINSTSIMDISEILRSEYPELIIHGDCPNGIDAFAKQWALNNGIPQIPMPARWDYYSTSPYLKRSEAGPDRNYDMCKMVAMLKVYGHEVICLGFPKGENWSGTRHCMTSAERWGIEVKEFVI